MSSTLFWRPAQPAKSRTLPDDLKRALRCTERTFDDGDPTDDAYLLGLQDAGIDGAGKLRDLVEKHGRVTVWVES